MSAIAVIPGKDRSDVLSDKHYRAIFDASAIGILQCSLDGRVMESNAAIQRLLGYSSQELCGMHFGQFTHPDDLSADNQLFQEMVEGKRSFYQMELRYRGRHGSSGWVRLTVSLVRDSGERPESVIGMVEDITESKRTEQQLREAQKMEIIGRLVGGVAHDFNNLLTGIMLYCDLVRDGLAQESRLRHHADEIRLAAEQGAALVQQLMSVVRPQSAEPRLLCVNNIIVGMRNLLDRLIGENIRLETSLPPDLWRVKIDPTQLQQIILNLVLNARDAMPDGGKIRLETRNLKRAGQATWVELVISDDGCGISPEVRARLFEPFFTTKAPGRGNGLGLATVHRIVQSSQGSIRVESAPGQGTRVAIRLPRAANVPAAESPSLSETSVPNGQATILLVEDNVPVRRAALRILQKAGYTVLDACDGGRALQICQQHPGAVDLLLVDLVMPGMRGRDVAATLQALRPKLRVLYMSGYDASAGEAPVVFFRKPFSSQTLIEKVREILQPAPASTPKRGILS